MRAHSFVARQHSSVTKTTEPTISHLADARTEPRGCGSSRLTVSYDRRMDVSVPPESGERRRRRRIVPGGIIDLKRVLARRGGPAGLGIGAACALFGGLVMKLSSGALVGAVGYVLVAFGVPLLSVVGIPAVSSTGRWAVALIGSAALWWAIGHFSAARVRRRVIAGWQEWAKEFALYAGGVWLGVILGLVLAAKSLGAI